METYLHPNLNVKGNAAHYVQEYCQSFYEFFDLAQLLTQLMTVVNQFSSVS